MQGGYGMGNMGGSSGEHNAYYQMNSRPTGGRTGRGGIVPFRAGDWKCGNDGCYYHNFAKNVSTQCIHSSTGFFVLTDT